MSTVVLVKLLAIFAVIGIGWLAGRTRLIGPEAATTLTRAAFVIFTPALLFRTTAGIAVAQLPWTTLGAYYLPTASLMLATYGIVRLRHRSAPAAPAIRALSVTFSNTVQLGIPVVAALYGTAGLAIHIAIVSLQSLILLTMGTILVEAGPGHPAASGRATRWRTARRVVLHPVVLPILLGLAFNATGLRLAGPVDDVLATLGQAVIPVSLVAIGLGLRLYGVAGHVRQAVVVCAGKLLLQPAVVLLVAGWGFGLRGLPLTIVVLCAALPVGSNVLLFASRYDVLMAETTAAIVASTCAFLVTGTLWLALLPLLGGTLH